MNELVTKQGVIDSPRPGFWVNASDLNKTIEAGRRREAALRGDLEKQIARANDFASKLTGAQQRLTEANERLVLLEAENATARQQAFGETATICTRLAYGEYYPTGKCYQAFIPKERQDRGDLLANAATAIRAAALKPAPLDYGALDATQRLAVCRGQQ